PRSTLFPYTTLFRSALQAVDGLLRARRHRGQPLPGQFVLGLFLGDLAQGPAGGDLVPGLRLGDGDLQADVLQAFAGALVVGVDRSEEHTSELQSLAY